MIFVIALLGLQLASGANQNGTGRLTIALVRHLDRPDASAVVIHQPGRNQGDVILLRTDATPLELATALASYTRIRRRPESARVAIALTKGQPRQTALQAEFARKLLTRLRSAPERDLAGVGRARAEEVVFDRGAIKASR